MEEKVYQTLEKIVGSDNISKELAILDGYAWQWMGDWSPELGNKFKTYRAEAVAMPGSTEETQAIVKICNRYGLKFKPHSTGLGAPSVNEGEECIILDMRRMNRILKINEEDMYAVVEPYVTWIQLLSEGHKRGLDAPQVGTGGHTSVLASCTAMLGMGYKNISMGYNERNILGVEWILPDGEILNLGSLGSGAGWISGDGPGPSLRGIMRGYCGTMGEMGVFTKCAVRLYTWGGPSEMTTENLGPRMELSKYPENTEVYFLYFETYEDRDKFILKIGEECIGHAAAILGRHIISLVMGENNRESVKMRKQLAELLPEISFVLVLSANSERELNYQKKVVEAIMKETNGKNFKLIAQDPELRKSLIFSLIKEGGTALRALGLTTSFATVNTDTFATTKFGKADKKTIELVNENIDEDVMYNGSELDWGTVIDNAFFTHVENMILYNPHDPKSAKIIEKIDRKIVETHIKKEIGSAPFQSPENVPMKLRPNHDAIRKYASCDYVKWQSMIKKVLDPNDVTESYLTPASEERDFN